MTQRANRTVYVVFPPTLAKQTQSILAAGPAWRRPRRSRWPRQSQTSMTLSAGEGRHSQRPSLAPDRRRRASAKRYYRHPDGTPTGEDANIRCSLAPMIELTGDITPSQLRPAHVKAYIAEGIERDWPRRAAEARLPSEPCAPCSVESTNRSSQPRAPDRDDSDTNNLLNRRSAEPEYEARPTSPTPPARRRDTAPRSVR